MDFDTLPIEVAELRRATDQLSAEIASIHSRTISLPDTHAFSNINVRLDAIEKAVSAISQQIPVINQNFSNHRQCIQQLAERLRKLERENGRPPPQNSPDVGQEEAPKTGENRKDEDGKVDEVQQLPERSFVAQFRAAKKRRIEEHEAQLCTKAEEPSLTRASN